jgi:hypothetical protein
VLEIPDVVGRSALRDLVHALLVVLGGPVVTRGGGVIAHGEPLVVQDLIPEEAEGLSFCSPIGQGIRVGLLTASNTSSNVGWTRKPM